MFNIEFSLVAWLEARGYSAFGDVPENRNDYDEFITIERTGGNMDNVIIDHPVLAIQCWAQTRSNASNLANEIYRIISEFAYEPHIAKVVRNSLYNFPDEVGKLARYQIVVEITATN